jgi:Protein of unknown function (DUF3102)
MSADLTNETAGAFDYSMLPAEVAEALRNQTKRIRDRLRNTMEAIIEIGRDLLAVQEKLEHGQFCKWVEAECGFTVRSADNYMNVARMAADNLETVSILPPAVAYLIAPKKTPADILDQVLAAAAAGETIDPKVVKGQLTRARHVRDEEFREALKKQKRSAAHKRWRDAKSEKSRVESEERERKHKADVRAAALTIIERYGEDGARLLLGVPNIFSVLGAIEAELDVRHAVHLEAA